MTPLFVQDLAALQRKLSCPPPRLAALLPRFRAQLQTDAEFRRHHIFLPALLGEPGPLAEAKRIILEEACHPLILAGARSLPESVHARQTLDEHIWCMAPRALRLAAFFTWLEVQGAWTPSERCTVATGLMDFFYDFVVPVLRARIPAGHNQQFSMTLCSAVAGAIGADVPEAAARAIALRDFALPKLHQTLGLLKHDAYSGEGSAYQTSVVSPLSMWAGLFLAQQGDADAWTRTWAPNHACLLDMLHLEVGLASPGGLLPPWDQYGWEPLRHLAARALWASLSGDHACLDAAASAWTRPTSLAWRPDDRLWTLLCWPEVERPTPRKARVLSGWSRPTVGAAIDHRPRKMRILVAWDACSWSLQGICRMQVNPNHLMIDLAGEPVTADGADRGREPLFPSAAAARTLESLTATERALVVQQYGSLERWVSMSQQGFLGAACAILIDGCEGYFPRGTRRGRLVFEQRADDRHTFAGEAAAYYQPAFDVTRTRRTVSVGASGVAWIVDDVAAASPHTFAWRAWFRREARRDGAQALRIDLPSGVALTLAWTGRADGCEELGPLDLSDSAIFPAARSGSAWPSDGSTRGELALRGSCVRIVTCLVPASVDALRIRTTAPDAWEATWDGGSDVFALPQELRAPAESAIAAEDVGADAETICDLDDAPFALLTAPDVALLAALSDPPVTAWRLTTAAMQTLVARGNATALPAILRLLEDATQNYTVHAVAAWCLGRAAYEPARATLQRMARIPEENTAQRARWAVARIEAHHAPESEGAP